MSKTEKKIDYTIYIYIAIIVLTAIPLIMPLGLPVPIDPQTIEVYDLIEGLQPGTYVLVGGTFNVAMWSDVGPGWVVIFDHLFDKDVKIVFADFGMGDSALLIDKYIELPQDKVYGVDFVNLGLIPGAETAQAAFASDIQTIAQSDISGIPTSQLPIMQGLSDLNDFSLTIFGADGSEKAAGQWKQKYGVPLIGYPNTMGTPPVIPFYISGQIDALLAGLSGGTQYEILRGKPGNGAATMDAQSLSHILVIGLIVIGNFNLLVRKEAKK